MLRLEGGICPLQICGIWDQVSRPFRVVTNDLCSWLLRTP